MIMCLLNQQECFVYRKELWPWKQEYDYLVLQIRYTKLLTNPSEMVNQLNLYRKKVKISFHFGTLDMQFCWKKSMHDQEY